MSTGKEEQSTLYHTKRLTLGSRSEHIWKTVQSAGHNEGTDRTEHFLQDDIWQRKKPLTSHVTGAALPNLLHTHPRVFQSPVAITILSANLALAVI
jgi:hypothetical protein